MHVNPRAGHAGRPTLDELMKRRANVIDVATKLFVDQGYAATSLIDIARSANVSTRTLYNHIGDKECIFVEVIQNAFRDLSDDTITVESFSDIDTVLRQAAIYLQEFWLNNIRSGVARLLVGEAARFPDIAEAGLEMMLDRPRKAVAKCFESMLQHGLIGIINTDLLSAMFIDCVGGVGGLLNKSALIGVRPDPSEVEERIAIFITGISPR